MQRPWGQVEMGTECIAHGKQRLEVILRSPKAHAHRSCSTVPCWHPGKPAPQPTANLTSAPGLLNCSRMAKPAASAPRTLVTSVPQLVLPGGPAPELNVAQAGCLSQDWGTHTQRPSLLPLTYITESPPLLVLHRVPGPVTPLKGCWHSTGGGLWSPPSWRGSPWRQPEYGQPDWAQGSADQTGRRQKLEYC